MNDLRAPKYGLTKRPDLSILCPLHLTVEIFLVREAADSEYRVNTGLRLCHQYQIPSAINVS